jgi:hypothetical protein
MLLVRIDCPAEAPRVAGMGRGGGEETPHRGDPTGRSGAHRPSAGRNGRRERLDGASFLDALKSEDAYR